MNSQPDAIPKEPSIRPSTPGLGWDEFSKELVEFFASVKLAIFLFLFIAMTATIGTVIQQGERAEVYVQEYGENAYRWFLRLGFTDVYHTWWFTSLLGLLCVNSLTCFYKRFPSVWRSMKQDKVGVTMAFVKNMKQQAEIPLANTKEAVAQLVSQPVRRKLPDERRAITHKFDIQGHEGYITVGLFEDGQPGEIFLVMAKEGSTISGFADAFAQAISYALQYGVPLQALVDKFSHVRFEPSGMTKNAEIRFAKSIVDYIFRWMATKFLSPEAQFRAGVNIDSPAEAPVAEAPKVEAVAPKVTVAVATAADPAPAKAEDKKASSFAAIQNQEDAPPCSTCGSIMIRSGSCYKCANCGTTSGCA